MTQRITEKAQRFAEDTQNTWEFAIIVFMYAVLITAIFTFPLVLFWRTHIPGLAISDGINHAWYAWWYQHAFFDLGHSPAEIDLLYYPHEYSHPLMTATPWSRFLPSFAVYFGASMQEAYNVHLFFSYVFTWVFMSLLCRELTGNREAAILGGAIFAFFPNRNMHALSGHFTQILTYTYPLLVLALWRIWKKPTLKRGVWWGAAFVVTATVDLMPLAYFAVPVVGIMLLFFLLKDRMHLLSGAMLKSLGIGVVIIALVMIPLFFPLVLPAMQGGLGWYQEGGLTDFSADLISIVVPPPGHFLNRVWPSLLGLSENVYYFGVSFFEAVVYIGWVVLAWAVLGVIKMGKEYSDVKLWLLIAIGSSILALGSVLRVAGEVITLGDGSVINLPYYFVSQLPLLSWGRTPARLHFTAMFAVAILASYGLAWLFSRVKRSVWRLSLMAALLLLIFLDSKTHFPWPMLELSIPEFYEQIAADDEAGAIFDLPSDNYMADKYAMLYQTVHLRPITAGRAYRTPPEVEDFRQELTEAVANGHMEILDQNGIAYVVLQRDFLTASEVEMFRLQLTKHLGASVYEDEKIVAFTTLMNSK